MVDFVVFSLNVQVAAMSTDDQPLMGQCAVNSGNIFFLPGLQATFSLFLNGSYALALLSGEFAFCQLITPVRYYLNL